MVNAKIQDLKRDSDRIFYVKSYGNNFNVCQEIDGREYYIMQADTLDDAHGILCVISNFLTNYRVAKLIKEEARLDKTEKLIQNNLEQLKRAQTPIGGTKN